ncbi:DNA polymerase III subunit delta [Curtobacterium sp. 'Ferrero']|nr:DNA polymerase III subunit delta [Curtobacterium sp. 'Ferrero']
MPAKKPARATAKIDQVPWSGIRPAPVVLVTGPEQFLAERAVGALRDLLVGEDPALEVHDLEADQYAPGLLATLASPSLFGEPRLVRVTNVEKCTDAFIAETIAYLQAPADDVTLVLRHGGGMRGKKLLDTIRSGVGGGVEVQCDELKRDTDRVDFVNAEFRAARRRIAPSAVRTLVAAFADDLAELAAACRQLLADSADEITDKVVDKYYGGRVETNAFKVADIALAGRSAPAIVELRHALATGEAPVPIVAAFASKIRTMAKVSAFRGPSGQAASALGMAPWQVQRAQRDVAGWSEAGLANAILSIAAADTAVKGGSRDAHYALEVMVRTIARRGEER